MANKKKPRSQPNPRSRGDQNIIRGNISGGITTQGRNARVTVHQYSGTDVGELSSLFKELYQRVDARPADPNVDKDEITQTVQNLEKEAAKGEEANQTKLERWMANLNQMAPDILDVIVASLGGPVSGFTAVFKKIAEHARQ